MVDRGTKVRERTENSTITWNFLPVLPLHCQSSVLQLQNPTKRHCHLLKCYSHFQSPSCIQKIETSRHRIKNTSAQVVRLHLCILKCVADTHSLLCASLITVGVKTGNHIQHTHCIRLLHLWHQDPSHCLRLYDLHNQAQNPNEGDFSLSIYWITIFSSQSFQLISWK